MAIIRNNEVTLYNIFFRYLVSFCVSTFLSIFLPFIIFITGINMGILLPANYTQNNLEKLRNELLNTNTFDEDKIAHPYKYGFYDEKLEIMNSNFSENQINEAYKYLKGESFKSNYIYEKIEVNDGICVISYDIKAHFSSQKLNDIIPYPEIFIIILFFVLLFINCIMLVRRFGKKLKSELKPLKKSTELIISRDLDFEVVPTNIKEFNEILTSIDNMKEALKQSLETQWKSEQKKKEQMIALAHDIKTPLTIIKGNAELLSESDSLSDDKEYIDFIITNANKIEQYTSLLIDISKEESDIDYKIEKIGFNDFMYNFKYEFNMLCKRKNIKGIINIYDSPTNFKANKQLLMRALTNIIINAIEHSNEEDLVEVDISKENNKLIFTVKDCGIGFTKEGLKKATNQFYMEESERKVGKHYGIGLYIAETIAKKHGGEIELKNREDMQGAEVSLAINLFS